MGSLMIFYIVIMWIMFVSYLLALVWAIGQSSSCIQIEMGYTGLR